jgi:choline dehydrogenase-like flavoprotein
VNGTREADSAFAAVEPVFAALVDATCPSAGLTQQLRSSVVDEVATLVDALNPTSRRAVIVAARILDRGTGRTRFRALDPAAASARLEELARRRPQVWRLLRLLRDLVVVAYYEQPDARRVVGYDPDPYIAAKARRRLADHGSDIDAHRRLLVEPAPLVTSAATSESARRTRHPPGAIRSALEMPERIECDVIVIGSGAGGAVVAAEVAEAGLAVVVLEEGGHHPTESFTAKTTDALRRMYRDAGASTTIGPTPVGWSEGRCVGGSTVVNGGMAFRGSERVLDDWALRAGTRELDAQHLAAEYERVERFLSVGLPDPPSIGRDQQLLRAGAERLGWRVIEDSRAHVHCTGCNVCTWGCPTGAKQSTLVSYLPRATQFGAHVWSDCRVRRILFRGKRAVGVEAEVVGDGKRVEVHAERIVVACGAVQTPALLQRSGVRQPSRQIGRNLFLHPGASMVAVFDEVVDGWKGAHQTYQVREFEREGFVLAAVNLPPSLVARSLPHQGGALGHVMEQYPYMVTAGVLVEDTHSGRVRSVRSDALVTYRLTDVDAERVVRASSLLCEALLEAGAHTVHLPFEGRPPVHDPGELREVTAVPIRPSTLAASTVHLMGTARLGTDPGTAVCDPTGAVYDTAGLFVADASLFPAPLGVNPMLTIMALATRVAAGIIEGWQRW